MPHGPGVMGQVGGRLASLRKCPLTGSREVAQHDGGILARRRRVKGLAQGTVAARRTSLWSRGRAALRRAVAGSTRPIPCASILDRDLPAVRIVAPGRDVAGRIELKDTDDVDADTVTVLGDPVDALDENRLIR